MSITERIVESLGQLRSLLSQKEKIMSDQSVIEPTTTTPDATALSPAESFANEVAVPAVNASDTPAAADAIPQPAASSVATDVPPQSSVSPVDTADAIPQPVASSVATDAPPQSSASPVVTADAVPQPAMAASAVDQDISASVKDFTQAFNFVEQGVVQLGVAAKDELIALARKYL